MAIVEVINYDGNPDVFAWKFPNTELGTWTQLIVNESQEAVLFKGGRICDVFQAGRHTLSTENIPILNKIVNLPFGGRSPFQAEVWYVNKVFSLDIKWGTSTPIQLQDPKYKVFVPVRAFGQFGIQIKDAQTFLVKLVGNLPQFDKTSILKFFRGIYLTKSKDAISSYLVHKGVSVLEINAYLDEISVYLQERISPTFEEYGITLTSFYVNDINVPEDDMAVQKLKEALAKRAEMDIVGYSYQQERSFDTLEGAANNPNAMQGTLMGAGIGLGMGVGMGNMVGQQFGNITENLSTESKKNCPKCNVQMRESERFCSNCGFDTSQKSESKQGARIRCSKCGALLAENTKFCPECGKKYRPCVKCKNDLLEDSTVCPTCGESQPKECPQCGGLVIHSQKFCPECGYSFVRKCPSCGAVVENGVKFCAECGQQL